MNINDLIHGFRVLERTPLPELDATMWRMEYEKNGADLVFLEVLSHAVDDLAGLADELDELTRHSTLQTIDASNTVANLHDGTHFAGTDAGVEGIKLLAQRFIN